MIEIAQYIIYIELPLKQEQYELLNSLFSMIRAEYLTLIHTSVKKVIAIVLME
jgi:hypothetical protein